MSLERTRDPGLGTLLVHGVVILGAVLILAPLMVLRVLVGGLSELLIRLTDGLNDALADRLSQ
jgi:hypothetical protein